MGFLLKENDKYKVKKSKEKCWEVEIDTVDQCGKAPNSVDVFIHPLAKVKIEKLMEEFDKIEWLAYLIGNENEVTDIFVPKQKVSVGSVTGVDTSVCNILPVIGVIHSHHDMGNGFSGTDNEWINQNNDISLCISNKGINGQVRWKTPCGSLNIIKACVKLKLDVEYDVEKFDKMIKKNIEEHVMVLPRNSYRYTNYKDDDDVGKSVDKYLENIGRYNMDDDSDERTLEEELRYMEDSGMFIDEDDEENIFTT